MPGPSWYGGAVFQGTLKTPANQIAVAPMPQVVRPMTGTVHRQRRRRHLAAVRALHEPQGRHRLPDLGHHRRTTTRPTTPPATRPTRPRPKNWLAKQDASGYFAGDLSRPLQAAADQVWPGWGSGQFSQEAIWAATVTPGMTAGQDHRLPAARLAGRDRQVRPGQRLQGRPVTAPTPRPARARRRRPRHAVRPEPGRHRLRRRLRGPAGRLRLLPTGYAVYFAFTDAGGTFTGLSNFTTAAQRLPLHACRRAMSRCTCSVLAGLPRRVRRRPGAAAAPPGARGGVSKALRFLYYIPGALAGAASVLVWLFVLDPTVSPVGFLLRARWGSTPSARSIAPGHLPLLFTLIAFWTGAGGWIVVMYGALNNISPGRHGGRADRRRRRLADRLAHPDPACCASGSSTW